MRPHVLSRGTLDAERRQPHRFDGGRSCRPLTVAWATTLAAVRSRLDGMGAEGHRAAPVRSSKPALAATVATAATVEQWSATPADATPA